MEVTAEDLLVALDVLNDDSADEALVAWAWSVLSTLFPSAPFAVASAVAFCFVKCRSSSSNSLRPTITSMSGWRAGSRVVSGSSTRKLARTGDSCLHSASARFSGEKPWF